MKSYLSKFLISTLFLSTTRYRLLSATTNYWRNMSTTGTSVEMSCPSKYSIGYITISNSDQAKELAKKLVQENIVACVNIVPTVTSIYKWKNKLEEDNESLMILKTRTEKQSDLIDFVKKNHPYDVPEIIFAPILNGNPDYLKWVSESVQMTDK